MIDITLTKHDGIDYIEFRKPFFQPNEIEMAKSFGFVFNTDTNVITGVIRQTGKKPLFYFIKNSYKNFNDSPLEKQRRDAFYSKLKVIYDGLEKDVEGRMKTVLPYSDMLFKHQSETLKECFYKKHNFLAFSMGLGKTITAASLSRLWQSQCTLIVCPSSVKWNWYRDLIKFKYNELFFSILDASKKRSIKAFQERFVVVNYEMLERYSEYILALPIQHIILDESHLIKNIQSNRFKNLNRIIKEFPESKITFLSGTPIKNRVDDVYSYLKLIKHELGLNKNKFLEAYTTRIKYRITGGKNLDDLRIKLSNFMIRKTKEECLDLPEKVFLNYRYELSDYKTEYNGIIAELSAQKSLAAMNGHIHALNNITAKAKVKGVIEIADTVLEQGKKVVIFSSYKAPLEMLENHFGKSCVKIDGSVNAFDRDKLIQKFTNDPNCTVFLANMIAGGVGINLVNASDVIFTNLPFVPGDLYQAIDRCHRIGQKNSVNVHLTFCDDSVDDDIYEIIVGKEGDINKLVDNSKDVIDRESFTKVLMRKLFGREKIISPLFDESIENKTSSEMAVVDQRTVVVDKNELPDFN